MTLKIAILSNSGNVGKTTIADYVFKPRIPSAEVIKIETINNDDTDDEKISAKNISEVIERIDFTDYAIIDVGASNIENLMSGFNKVANLHEDIDFFFIPTTQNVKQQKDTIETIFNLEILGVNHDKMKIIFNFYDCDIPINKQYHIIFDKLSHKLNLDNVNNQFCIEENPVFELLGVVNMNLKEILDDKTDYKELMQSTDIREVRSIYSKKRTTQRMAVSFNSKMNDIYNKIANTCGFSKLINSKD